ncbi:MAG: cation diffusion facilitator family transporter [Odoribacteraceae bacterium]|jgi:cation diffusion facilitator family transporter|nr:cation diffusion facilitator family transporter [Odoribacteraceae bacterium]
MKKIKFIRVNPSHSPANSNTRESPSREIILLRASWISTIGNAALSAAKIAAGYLAGSIAVIGDGIDSATDIAISLVMVFTASLIRRPPDKKHVYGYGKAESVATKVLSLLIFYAGARVLLASGSDILDAIRGESADREIPLPLAIHVTFFSIVAKLALTAYQARQARRANSILLRANARNMLNDVYLSSCVLFGLFCTFALDLPLLDSVTGLLVSLFIIRGSLHIFKESNVELMDGVSDETVYARIFEAVERVPGARNPHRTRSRQIGGMYMIDLDIEVDGDLSLREAHAIADAVERSIKEAIENVYDIVVHVEPCGHCSRDEKYGVDRFST